MRGTQALADKERAKAQEMIAKKRLRQLNPDNLTVKEFASYRVRLEETQVSTRAVDGAIFAQHAGHNTRA